MKDALPLVTTSTVGRLIPVLLIAVSIVLLITVPSVHLSEQTGWKRDTSSIPETLSLCLSRSGMIEDGTLGANITGPHQGITNSSLIFSGENSTASCSSTIVKWLWDFGDGSLAEGPAVNHTFRVPGRFTVFLSITDDSDNVALASHVIDISSLQGNTPPIAQLSARELTVLVGESVTLLGNESYDIDGDPLEYWWDLDTSDTITVDSRQAAPEYTWLAPGNVTIRLTVADTEGAFSTVEMLVHIVPDPNAGADINDTGANGATQDQKTAQDSTASILPLVIVIIVLIVTVVITQYLLFRGYLQLKEQEPLERPSGTPRRSERLPPSTAPRAIEHRHSSPIYQFESLQDHQPPSRVRGVYHPYHLEKKGVYSRWGETAPPHRASLYEPPKELDLAQSPYMAPRWPQNDPSHTSMVYESPNELNLSKSPYLDRTPQKPPSQSKIYEKE